MPKPGFVAVSGLIWNSPISPAAPLAFGLKPLSCAACALSTSTGMPVSFEASWKYGSYSAGIGGAFTAPP